MRTLMRGDAIKWLAVLIAGLLIADLLVDKPGYLAWERWFASYALMALIVGAFLGAVAPAAARALLRRGDGDGDGDDRSVRRNSDELPHRENGDV